MQYKRIRIYALLTLALFIFYFTADFTIVDIEKSALIVALGIDKEENEYNVTCQIAVPEANDTGAKNSGALVTSKGNSLFEAINKISYSTGWYPKLSFCNLIVLGESMLNENVMDVFDFFIRSYKVEDNAIICFTENTAEKLLSSTSPLDNVSSFSLTKIFVKDVVNANKVYTSTIRDFSIGYFSRSKFGFIPYIKSTKIPKPSSENEESSSSQSSSVDAGLSGSSGSGDGTGNGGNGATIFDATTLLLFDNGFKKSELMGNESLFYSLLDKKGNDAFFTIEAVDNNGRRGTFLVNILNSKSKVKLENNNNEFQLKINLDLWIRITDFENNQTIDALSNLGRLNENMLYNSKIVAENYLNSIIKKSKESNVDVFNLRNELYKYHPKKYDEYKYKIIKDYTPIIKVTCHNFT